LPVLGCVFIKSEDMAQQIVISSMTTHAGYEDMFESLF
jgi:hypothetical protein